MAYLLFELGVEEVPVADIAPIKEQLKNSFETKLNENSISFKTIDVAATNKRFMVYIFNMAEKSSNKEESILGPAKKNAYQPDGKPTIALTKFLETNKTKQNELLEVETKKGVYMGINRIIPGKETSQILQGIIPQILGGLNFSKTMVWNESRVPFIRPIKNILALFNKELIPFTYAGIKTSQAVYGHHLLSDNPVQINSYKDYIELLNKNFVIVREEERKAKILEEIKEIEEDLKSKVKINDEMLDHYVYCNEYPVLFCGQFDPKYLQLPEEIIATFMIREKKLSPLFLASDKLINYFIGVSNIPDENNYVVKGNEKVIQAAFEDAIFFWEKDLREDFFNHRESLKEIIFHKKIGTFYEKTERMSRYVEMLAKMVHYKNKIDILKKAAHHCKNDLVTRMVREFPSLQGIMGGLYLKDKNAEKDLWQAVYGHYEPKGFSRDKLTSLPAAILSIADKMDNIIGLIHNGVKVSSSKDPYGLRRDANAIIKCMIDFHFDFDLTDFIKMIAFEYCSPKDKMEELVEEIREFFLSRLENIFKDMLNFRYDVVNATLNTPTLFIYKTYLRTVEIARIVESESMRQLVSIHKRLKNIIKEFPIYNISEDNLIEKEERFLFEVFKESKESIENAILFNNYLEACSKILEMKPIIDTFFDKILIMSPDEKTKQNRLALLQRINELMTKIADFSLII